jgi:hypothetical protein
MSGPENTFIGSVHKHLPIELYRMKNHNQFNSGIADVWYSGSKADFWIEYKFVKVPVRDTTVIDFGLSALQKDWLTKRSMEGRNIGVIVGSKDGGVWLPNTSFEFQLDAKTFRSMIRSRKDLAALIVCLTQAQ